MAGQTHRTVSIWPLELTGEPPHIQAGTCGECFPEPPPQPCTIESALVKNEDQGKGQGGLRQGQARAKGLSLGEGGD